MGQDGRVGASVGSTGGVGAARGPGGWLRRWAHYFNRVVVIIKSLLGGWHEHHLKLVPQVSRKNENHD